MQTGEKPQIKIMIIGEPQAGKTTLANHLVYKSGSLDPQIIERLNPNISEFGEESWRLYHILNKFNSERKEDMSINMSFNKFQTEKYDFNIIRASSHSAFVIDVIAGASLADAVIYMPAPKIGDYEAGINQMESSRIQSILAFMLGVKNWIVCINNMDNKCINYSQEYFEESKKEQSDYLKKVGYNPSTIPFIPISSWSGENIFKKSPNLSWFKGPTLLEALNNITPPKKPVDKPFRLSIQDIYKVKEIGKVYAGKIEAGVMRLEMSICINPSNVTTNIKAIQVAGKEVQEAVAGDYVGFTIWADDKRPIRRGFVCCQSQSNPPKQVTQFGTQVIVHNFPANVYAGYCPVIECHNLRIACKYTGITKIDRKTGKVLEGTSFQKGDCAIINMTPLKPMYVETFEDYPSLGRFVVRDMRQTVAFGIIKWIETKPAS